MFEAKSVTRAATPAAVEVAKAAILAMSEAEETGRIAEASASHGSREGMNHRRSRP